MEWGTVAIKKGSARENGGPSALKMAGQFRVAYSAESFWPSIRISIILRSCARLFAVSSA